MKFSFFLLLILLIVSCSKKQHEPSGIIPATPGIHIIGEWQWVESLTGWGDIIKPDTDSTVRLKLIDDSTYAVTLNNQTRYTGHFSTFISPSPDSSVVLECDRNFSVNRLRFRNQETILYLKNDTCRFYDYLVADGNAHLFKRVQ